MTKKELMAWLSTQPDNMNIRFSSEGYSYEIGFAMVVPEWNVAYLGVNKEELAESLAEEMEADMEADLATDRDAYLEALESSENEACAIEGGCAGGVVLRKDLPAVDAATGVM